MSRTQFIHGFNEAVAGLPANALKARTFLLQALSLSGAGAAARGASMTQSPRREELAVLLPWYAAGTQTRREARAIDRAAREDARLAERLETVRAEIAETVRVNESLGGPSPRAHQKLFAAIEADRRSGPPGGGSVRALPMSRLWLI